MTNITNEIIKQVCSYGKVNTNDINLDMDIFESGYLDSIESLEFSIYLCNKYSNISHKMLSNLEKVSVNSITSLIVNS